MKDSQQESHTAKIFKWTLTMINVGVTVLLIYAMARNGAAPDWQGSTYWFSIGAVLMNITISTRSIVQYTWKP